ETSILRLDGLLWTWLFVTLVFIQFASPTLAQISSASINGTVRDTSGAVIPEVHLLLTNVDTSVEKTTISNDAGNYVFLGILPGNYTLLATKAGFNTNQLKPFTLVVNQTATFDFTLAVGGVAQTVSVTAVGAALQASTTELGRLISRQEVLDLPLNGRNF